MKRDIILDAWRGVAILMVIAHHLLYFHFDTANTIVRFFAERSGPWGVKLFFIISGYIITRLMLEEESLQGSLSLYAFYVRRIFRILPPYLFYVVAVAGFAGLGWVPLSLSDGAHALGFICNTGVDCNWQVIHTWTLAIEVQFYLVWPLVFVLLPAWWRGYFLSALIAVLVALSAFELFMARGWIDNAGSFACIALGALYATSPRFRGYIRRFGLWTLAAGALAVALFLALGWGDAAHALYRALIPAALVVAVFLPYQYAALARLRPVAWLSYIGLISYSLYLWQQVFAAPAENYLHPSLLQYSLLMVAFAFLSYYMVELPSVRLGKAVLHRKVTQTEREAQGL